jgi:saccharopine dehydrogenase-like NADP-dependent oxidoreductase
MGKRAVVLGGGMVGAVIAEDLLEEEGLQVTLVDRDASRLEEVAQRSPGLTTRVADCSDPAALAALAAEADVVVGALASHLGFGALRAVLEAGKPYCDISFMAEDPLALDGLAREQGVTAVVDCGVAPGMTHMLVGYAVQALDRVDALKIYVGGLPRVRSWPFEYKAGFAPADVIEEYTRPVRVVEHGKVVVKEALSEPELLEFEGVGTLEAFNTDGLRSLVETLEVPHMVEKTMRYPGHRALMQAFRETGLFGTEPVTVRGAQVVPRELTSALLFPKWTFEEGEEDLTALRVIAEGARGEQPVSLRWDMLDRYDPATGRTSMSRTTAYPCAIVARLLLAGRVPQAGVLPPERLGAMPGVLDEVLAALRSRGVDYRPSEA